MLDSLPSIPAFAFLLLGCTPTGPAPSVLGDTWVAPPDGYFDDTNDLDDAVDPGPTERSPHARANEPASPTSKPHLAARGGQAVTATWNAVKQAAFEGSR